MDDALVQGSIYSSIIFDKVLILVVMDDALVLDKTPIFGILQEGLNPCCNG